MYLHPSPADFNKEILDAGAELPSGLDPTTFPILSRHWFGWRPVGDAAAVIVNDLRSQRQAAGGLG